MDVMENIPEFYILGLPVRTPIGNIHPIKVKEYVKLIRYIQILNLEDFEFKDILKTSISQDIDVDMRKSIEHLIKDVHFFYIIIEWGSSNKSNDNVFYHLYVAYKELFKLCFKEDVFDQIQTSEEFEEYRELIRNINSIKYKKPNPNPEIEKYNKLKQLLQAKKNDYITFKSMYTSILVQTGMNPNELTLYQFNEIFDRIGHFKNFDVTTLYRLLYENVDVNNWYEEDKEEKQNFITEKQLNEAKKQNKNGKQGLQNEL